MGWRIPHDHRRILLLLPTLNRANDSAKSAGCKSNLRQIGMALKLYVDKYENYPLWAPGYLPVSGMLAAFTQ
jgi:hypothetical protein